MGGQGLGGWAADGGQGRGIASRQRERPGCSHKIKHRRCTAPHPLPLRPDSHVRSGMQRPSGLPKLSAPSQERFLLYAEHLAQQVCLCMCVCCRHPA